LKLLGINHSTEFQTLNLPVDQCSLLVKSGPGESSLINKAMNRYSGAANRTKPVAQQNQSTTKKSLPVISGGESLSAGSHHLEF